MAIMTDVRPRVSPIPELVIWSHSDRWQHMGALIWLQLQWLRGSLLPHTQQTMMVHCAECTTHTSDGCWDRGDNGISVEHFKNHKHY